MPWWQGAFASSTKSQADNDSAVEADVGRHSAKPGLFSSRRNRNLQRARKLRHATENEVEIWRSPNHFENSSSRSSSSASTSTSASASSQPLPMPQLESLLQHDPKFSRSGSRTVSLPAPRGKVEIPRRKWGEKLQEKGKEGETIDVTIEELSPDAIDGFNGLNRLIEQGKRSNAERFGPRSSSKSPLKQNGKGRSSDSYNISIPSSAPTSPYSSPAPSPRRSDTSQYMTPPGVFQVWSAPEMPPLDGGFGFYQFYSEISASSVDNSPIQSPRVSNHARDTSPPRSVSPLNSKISSETSSRKREKESNAQGIVHPLPLPPSGSASQTSPISPFTSGLDFAGASAAKLEYSGSSASHSSPISPFLSRSDFSGASPAKLEYSGSNASHSSPISPFASRSGYSGASTAKHEYSGYSASHSSPISPFTSRSDFSGASPAKREYSGSSVSHPSPISPLTSRSDFSGASPAKLEYSGSSESHPSPISPFTSRSDFSGASTSKLEYSESSASRSTPISPFTSRSDFSGASVTKPEYSGSSLTIPHSPISPGPEAVPVKSQWQKGKLIGRGTFGTVYVASNRRTGALCAMKEVELLPDDSKSSESLKQLEQEINVLSHLKHPNIVQYYGSEIVDHKFYIYLEYVYPGSINKYINDHCGTMTESVVRNFTRHILSGLAYLHSKKTIHRDIKGANLLVDPHGVVKLADFGMAKHLSGQAANLSLKGSPYWLAPELLQSSLQDATSDTALAVDIWSLGCTIIEMMNGKPPWSEYEGAAALFKVLQESPTIPETLSPDGKDFLQLCFCRNPADRPTASMLLEHPFVNNSHLSDSCTQSFKEIKLSDNTPSLRERLYHKYDQVPASLESQIKKGKLGNNETIQGKLHQAPHLALVPFPSPRSTLDGLPALSPQGLGLYPHSPSTPGIFSSPRNHGAEKYTRK